jgi:hypothetical protein
MEKDREEERKKGTYGEEQVKKGRKGKGRKERRRLESYHGCPQNRRKDLACRPTAG